MKKIFWLPLATVLLLGCGPEQQKQDYSKDLLTAHPWRKIRYNKDSFIEDSLISHSVDSLYKDTESLTFEWDGTVYYYQPEFGSAVTGEWAFEAADHDLLTSLQRTIPGQGTVSYFTESGVTVSPGLLELGTVEYSTAEDGRTIKTLTLCLFRH